MTPEQIQRWLDKNSHRLDLPAQFLGDEPNAVRKPWDETEVRWLICASWPYEQAAGNQSIPATYRSINDAHSRNLCDRFYLPATARALKSFERDGVPVFGIESKHQLKDFDVVGTSISYLVLLMNFAKYLPMSDVPLRWRDREAQGAENFPMVIIGGQAFASPGAMEPIVDCVWLGEVEDEPGNGGIGQVCQRIAMFKQDGLWQADRVECYRKLAREFNYLYFPRFVETLYGYEDRRPVGCEEPSKQVVGYRSLLDGMRLPFKARKVKDMNNIRPLTAPPLLYSDPAGGAGDLEVGRGCPAWCSFCRLTYVQKPYRQRSVEYMADYAEEFQRNVGSVELTPFSPDFPMHTQRKALIERLLSISDEVDSSTMRVDDFIADGDYILLQVHGGMDSVTLGLEGNSQRMRDLVGKGTSDKDVEEAVTRGIRAGIRKFKFYMITNLPGEDEGDVLRIVRLAKRVADIRDSMGASNVRIQFSWTPLLIEAGTPFQWFAPTVATSTLIDVADAFRDLKIDFKIGTKAETNKVSYFQLCQRASSEVGEAIVDVIEKHNTGCWGGVPKTFREDLASALYDHGFHNGFADCFDERTKHDMFGWEYIDSGVSAELLWVTYLQMLEFVQYTDSETYDGAFRDQDYHGNEWIGRCDTNCLGKTCGVCDHKDLRIRTGYIRAAQQERHVDLSQVRSIDQTTVAFKIRCRIVKKEKYRFVTNAHWRYAVRRAAYRVLHTLTESGHCKMPEGCTIAKRSIRFGSDALKIKDWTCGTDYLEFAMTRRMTDIQLGQFMAGMSAELGSWFELGESWQPYPANVSMAADTDLSLFELEVDETQATMSDRLAAWESADYVKMILKQDTGFFALGSDEVNAKDFAEDLWLVRDGHELLIRMLVRGKAGPYNIYAALMGKASWVEAAQHAARRVDSFTEIQSAQADFLLPSCAECGKRVPVNLLEEPYDDTYCPKCKDESEGRIARVSVRA